MSTLLERNRSLLINESVRKHSVLCYQIITKRGTHTYILSLDIIVTSRNSIIELPRQQRNSNGISASPNIQAASKNAISIGLINNSRPLGGHKVCGWRSPPPLEPRINTAHIHEGLSLRKLTITKTSRFIYSYPNFSSTHL
jgi:hypothetical protein